MSSFPPIYIIVGISGAGRSTVLKTFEDRNYYCLDNLSIELLECSLDLIKEGKLRGKGYAFGLDVFDSNLISKFETFKKEKLSAFDHKMYFLTASDDIVISRFGATRRRHPLSEEASKLAVLIQKEKQMLEPLELLSDEVIDTSAFNPNQLCEHIEGIIGDKLPPRIMQVMISSFGFKHGQLTPAENLFDVRFLKNPFYVEELRNKTGLDQSVRDYVFSDPQSITLMKKLTDWFTYSLPIYYNEGKHYLRIGIGCTGGKHRSVCLAEALFHRLSTQTHENIKLQIFHRDIDV